MALLMLVSPGSAQNAQPSPSITGIEELEKLFEFTSFTDHYTQICVIVPYVKNSNFRYNLGLIRTQLKIELLTQNLDLSEREADKKIRKIYGKSIKDANYLVGNVGCNGPDRDIFVDHYKSLAIAEPDEIIRAMTALLSNSAH